VRFLTTTASLIVFYFFNFYRNVGPFRKRLYNEDNIEINNSIDCAISVYHDTVLNTGNGSVPKDAIRNNTAENTSTGEQQIKTYFSNQEYAVVVKKRTAAPAAQSSEFDLEGGSNQSQRCETEGCWSCCALFNNNSVFLI
jgi:hypothetical protein